MASTTFSGAVTSTNGFVGDVTGDITGNVTGNLTGDVQGPALATEAGTGFAAGTVATEVTKQGKTILTHIFIDLTGTASSTTLNDIIGDDDAASATICQISTAECGQIFTGSVTCLEVPTTGVNDVDFHASSASTGAEDADVTALADPVVILAAGGAWALGETQTITGLPTATSDYIYAAVGVAGTAGTYDAGQFLIEFVGYEA